MRWKRLSPMKWETFAALPVIRLSRQVTLVPEYINRVQMCEPRNPAPPMTTACLPSSSGKPPNPDRRMSDKSEASKILSGYIGRSAETLSRESHAGYDKLTPECPLVLHSSDGP